MKENSLGTEKITVLVLKMSIPVVISMSMQAIYNVADSIFLSHYSEIAFGGVSIIQPLLLISLALANGIGAGSGSLLSTLLGRKDLDGARKSISTGWSIALLMGFLCSLLLFVLAEPFSLHFTSDVVASDAAISYLRMISPSISLVFISSLLSFFLQSHGMAKRAMVMQTSGALVNIVLDPVLIFYFDMGAKGAALASAIGYSVTALLAFLFYFRSGCLKSSLGFSFPCAKRIFAVVLPATMVQGAGPIVGIVLNKMIISYSIEVMAVYGMYLKTESFMFLASQGISSALIVIVGYNYGMGNIERVKRSFKLSLLLSWSVMVIGFVFFQLFSKNIISVFTNDPYLIEIGVPAFKSLCFCFLLTAPNIVMTGLLQGLGKGWMSLVITYTRFFIFLIPFSFILNKLFGLSGLWFCYFSADIPTLFLLIWIYRYIDKRMFMCNKTQQTVA